MTPVHRRPTTRALASAVSAILLFAFAGDVHAGRVETADSGERRPRPKEGSEIEVSFNPTVTLTVQAGESIESLLDRLADAINDAGGGSYTARSESDATPAAVVVQREDGSEIDQLRFAENDPSIQSTRLTVDWPDLEARLRLQSESPSGGVVFVALNDRSIPVVTTGRDAEGLAQAMLNAILNAGFSATIVEDELLVERDLRDDTGLTVVGFRSTDPALVTSEIALQRPVTPPERELFDDIGSTALMGSLESMDSRQKVAGAVAALIPAVIIIAAGLLLRTGHRH